MPSIIKPSWLRQYHKGHHWLCCQSIVSARKEMARPARSWSSKRSRPCPPWQHKPFCQTCKVSYDACRSTFCSFLAFFAATPEHPSASAERLFKKRRACRDQVSLSSAVQAAPAAPSCNLESGNTCRERGAVAADWGAPQAEKRHKKRFQTVKNTV